MAVSLTECKLDNYLLPHAVILKTDIAQALQMVADTEGNLKHFLEPKSLISVFHAFRDCKARARFEVELDR